MAKKYRVTLTAEGRQELQSLIAKGKANAREEVVLKGEFYSALS